MKLAFKNISRESDPFSFCFRALSNPLNVFVFTRKEHFCGINQIYNSMFLADNFGMFHWVLSSLNFHVLGKGSHTTNPQSFLSVNENKKAKPAIHRINDNVYSARPSAGNLIIQTKKGKMYGNTI